MNISSPTSIEPLKAGLRHVTIFFSDIAGFSELNRKVGDLEASRIARRMLTLQEIIITRDGLGRILQFGGDSIFAVFDNASAALNRALEIQRVLDSVGGLDPGEAPPRLRIGLHMGEVLIKEGERIEIISRHVNRARRVMEAAAPGQILASEAVVEAARDFIEIPREFQAVQYYGEYYLKGVGATDLCEVADVRFRKPQAPQLPDAKNSEKSVLARLELAGYRPLEKLGEGASGVVYKASPGEAGAPVALKVLSPVLCEDAGGRQRFQAEADRMRELRIPGVAQLIEERLDHQPPFLVMGLIEGQPIDAALAGAPPERVARVFKEICLTLDRTHAAGIIHCDIKPGNILIQENDLPVILDFGIAVLQARQESSTLSSSNFLGTPAFLAPEIIGGKPRGAFTDIYSLGVVLFKVLTGREPFQGDSVHQILQAHLHEDPPLPAILRPDVADGLQRICLKALEKVPAERYPTARGMAEDLERFLRGEMVRTRPTVYDNLLYHRVQQHVEQVQDWAQRGLLNPEETHGLIASYEGLQRRGIPAVMEGRYYRFWQTVVYLGGWAVINGALLWLVQHWDSLGRAEKLLLGSVPGLTAFALAAAMWKVERFRLTFVALVVGILATPVLTGVWLHEFQVADQISERRLSYELLRDSPDSTKLTNQQLLIVSLATFLVAGGVMLFTGTTTHSAQTLISLLALYAAAYLLLGLKPELKHEKWATIAIKCVPLLLLLVVVAQWLLSHPRRYFQSPPWFYVAAFLLIAIFVGISLFGLKEWSTVRREVRDAASWLLLSCAGGVLALIGLLARSRLKHHCRPATLAVISLGLVGSLAGFARSGWKETWPGDWWAPSLFGSSVPMSHLLLPVLALGITLLACRYQMFSFLLVGLAGFAASIHLLGYLYFETAASWPKFMMVVGAICFFAALLLELRRTRGNTIDDVVSQSRF